MANISELFGKELAIVLADKILLVDDTFKANDFIHQIDIQTQGKMFSARQMIFAKQLKQFLPDDYPSALAILMAILGDENPNQTGMVSQFYWVLPIAKFVEQYGIAYFDESIHALAEITKRSTAEFAVRPFIRHYPQKMLDVLNAWAMSDNFHLRRLTSEGLRPKLPWASKLETFIDNPKPIFDLLEKLKEDDILYVKKSVGNHLTDWIKVNPESVKPLLRHWANSDNKHTQWIVKRATRKYPNFL